MKSPKTYEKLGIKNAIIIEKNRYTYKAKFKNKDNFIYRCSNRKNKAQVTINKDKLLKLLTKNKDSNINHIGKNPHSYDIKKENKIKEVPSEKILIEEVISKLGNNLIKYHREKSLSFHIDNLKVNKIPFNIIKIKNLLQKFRGENYLNDKNYLDYINCIKITYFK